MKLATYTTPEFGSEIGAVDPAAASILRLQAAARALHGRESDHFRDMLAWLRGGPAAIDLARETAARAADLPDCLLPLDQVRLLAPLPRPASLRDCMAFEQHVINVTRATRLRRWRRLDEWIEARFGRRRTLAYRLNRAWYQRPLYYKGNRFSVVGHDAEIAIPAFTRYFDYELEWGVIIGREGRDIPESEADGYIAGYTIYNDFSARDIQGREMAGNLGPAKGKDFDTGNVIGPWLVTPDELPDPYDLAMTARINGREWSRGSTADMGYSFAEIISYISRSETLYPGEFIGSGTCSGPQGSGCGLEMMRFLKAGDVVELAVEGIGVLRNRIAASAQGAGGRLAVREAAGSGPASTG